MLTVKLEYFGHLMLRYDSLEKPLILGKTEWRRRRGWQENEMVRWHPWLYGHEFEQALGAGEGQGNLAWCSPWSHKYSDMTKQTNCTEEKEMPTQSLPGKYHGQGSLAGFSPRGCKTAGTILVTKQKLLTIITIYFMILHSHLKPLCFRSLERITKSVYSLTNIPPSPQPVVSGNHHSSLCFYEFSVSRFPM